MQYNVIDRTLIVISYNFSEILSNVFTLYVKMPGSEPNKVNSGVQTCFRSAPTKYLDQVSLSSTPLNGEAY